MNSILNTIAIEEKALVVSDSMNPMEFFTTYPELANWEIMRNRIKDVKHQGLKTNIIYDIAGQEFTVAIITLSPDLRMVGYRVNKMKNNVYLGGRYCAETWYAIMAHLNWVYEKDEVVIH